LKLTQVHRGLWLSIVHRVSGSCLPESAAELQARCASRPAPVEGTSPRVAGVCSHCVAQTHMVGVVSLGPAAVADGSVSLCSSPRPALSAIPQQCWHSLSRRLYVSGRGVHAVAAQSMLIVAVVVGGEEENEGCDAAAACAVIEPPPRGCGDALCCCQCVWRCLVPAAALLCHGSLEFAAFCAIQEEAV
jgi:hypothetical protein